MCIRSSDCLTFLLFNHLFQVEFIQKFPPKEAENLPVWQCISFQALPAELRQQTAREVAGLGAARCREWLSGTRALGELDSLVSSELDWLHSLRSCRLNPVLETGVGCNEMGRASALR